ncbi:curli assembly chaperone CsgC [Scandinavium sp. V105_16]|uniref:Curli assembly protein CsgC n=1 Tax=Scandinavium lactucae TaxID=3095028 RepID=A0AAJ2S7T5_9ENTR|nr:MULTISPECIES: curli assembly chaperone CsgC [unclassified Scandinavium]MDX6022684.1 curli assembly chaperone CsgC [Scandinavium sp. V105_16]MDX6033474.1 curli assembly chaperone CsgC [Scandinavium sp. V105_12]MDX6042730.1 curli assembly chaperone CsgC [Scandinavium sp. V105_6]MDX6052731.1 curli assembly chaperone CsgC [Scandinavium sp. V105_1]
MNSLLIAVALTNSIAFNVTHQGEMYTITPQVTVTEPCQCQVKIQTMREGSGGSSNIQQSKNLSLPANQPIDISRMQLNISQNDTVKVVVTLTDGQALNLTAQWPNAERT